jgi:tetratricopeptide (TPR) repeat protein
MADSHLSPELLRMVLAGELPPKSLARLALLHMMELCPECRQAWATFKAGHPAAAGAMEAPPAQAAEAAPPPSPAAGRYSDAFERAAAAFTAHLEAPHAAAAEDGLEPGALRDEILALPAAERRGRVDAEPQRFRGRRLAETLLAASFAQRRRDPAEARDLAELAGAVLEATPEALAAAGEEAPAWAQSLSVRALAYRANALRCAGDLGTADRLFRHVRARLARFPLNDSRLHADVSSLEASLRLDQRRLPEAEALLDRAALLYREAGEPRQVAKIRVQQGDAFRQRGDLDEAATRLGEALRLIEDDAGADALRRDAVANLALVLCDAERPAAARGLLEEHRALFAAADDEWTRLRCRWVEGRVGAALGETGAAEQALAEAHGGFVRRGEAFNAALAALDLAALHLGAGRTAEVRRLAAETAPVFLQLEVGPEAATALVLFQRAAAAEEATLEAVHRLRRQLLAARRGGAAPGAVPS